MTDKNHETDPGEQLDKDALFIRQQKYAEQASTMPGPLIVATGIRTPENMGSILRHADAAGCSQVLFVDCNREVSSRKISRIARNSEQHLEVAYFSSEEFLSRLDTLPPLIAVEITSSSENIFTSQLPAYCALVVGSERYGIPESILKHCHQAVHIPMYGVNSSMNVTHALTIAMYEWRRQHSQ